MATFTWTIPTCEHVIADGGITGVVTQHKPKALVTTLLPTQPLAMALSV
jgi:hypothetical protein